MWNSVKLFTLVPPSKITCTLQFTSGHNPSNFFGYEYDAFLSVGDIRLGSPYSLLPPPTIPSPRIY